MKIYLSLVFLLIFCANFFAQTATRPTGTGTLSDPYLIGTLNELYWITQNSSSWNQAFKQTANIDASSTSTWNSGAGWPMIGNNTTNFAGIYDGQYYTITGLYRNGGSNVGLFGVVSTLYAVWAEIKNVKLVNCNITGSAGVGALIGGSNAVTISNCSATGQVYGTQYVGGLVGYGPTGQSITNSISSVTVNGPSNANKVGGLCGFVQNTTISQSYCTGTVTAGGTEIGGFIGSSTNATISNCFAGGSLTGSISSFAGGLLGSGSGNSVSYCYSSVARTTSTGGGGAFTNATGTYTSCYYDNGRWTVASGNTYAAALTTAQMKVQSNFSGWNFSTVWGTNTGINGGYPHLKVLLVPFVLSTPSAGTTFAAQQSINLVWLGTSSSTAKIESFINGVRSTVASNVNSITGPNTYNIVLPNSNATINFRISNQADTSSYAETGIFYTITTVAVAPLGSGTSVDPYLISTWNNLYWVSVNSSSWDKYFKQTANIDASITSQWYGGMGWPGIGNVNSEFKGIYDGQNFSVNNLFINRNADYIGLFSYVYSGGSVPQINNLRVLNCNITGRSSVAALAGYVSNGIISNCNSSGQVTGASITGGLIGNANNYIVITNCYSTANVTGPVSGNFLYIGGMIGASAYASISNSYSTGNVNAGSTYIGGFLGSDIGSTIRNCFAGGSISGNITGFAGGFLGYSSGSKVNNCFSFSTRATSVGSSGAFASGSGTFTGCYYDSTKWIPANNNTNATGLTTAQFTIPENLSGWDFSSTWRIHSTLNSGYPFLQYFAPLPVQITSPVTGYFASPGDTLQLKWTSINTSTVRIQLFINNVKSTITSGLTSNIGTNSYTVIFPGTSGTAKIRIVDEIDTTLFTESITFNLFFIPAGNGTLNSPYLITSLNDLLWVYNNPSTWNKFFNQTANIDASSSISMNGGAGWSLIGNSTTNFSGVYDGQNNTITGLYRNGGNNIGLFGVVNTNGANGFTAEIKNVKLVGCSFTGGSGVGTLIGTANNVKITNCSSSGAVSGTGSVGGLIGYGPTAQSISYSFSTASVAGTSGNSGQYFGGLSGYTENTTVTQCYSTAVITASGTYIGGLFGYVKNSTVTNSFAGASLTGTFLSPGSGFIGQTQSSTVTNCFSFSSSQNTGGGGGAFSTSLVSTFTNCKYDNTKWTWMNFYNNATALSSAQMKVQSNFAGYDFTSVWGISGSINNGYPHLLYFLTPLRISSPTADSNATPGGNITLNWYGQSARTVKIELIMNGVLSTITSSTSSVSGLNIFIVPLPNSVGSAKIRLTDISDTSVNAESPLFKIFVFPAQITPSGSGTVSDPYLISSLGELCWVTKNSSSWAKVFKQTANIDASASSTWPAGMWTPIGVNLDTCFKGNYDGQNYSITGLRINVSGSAGLFGVVHMTDFRNDAVPEIKNLKLIDFNITGDSQVGTLIGNGQEGIVDNCHSSGIVSGNNQVGGLLGYAPLHNVRNSSSSATVYTNGSGGGFSGATISTTIDRCFSTGNVYAGGTQSPIILVGGFAGEFGWTTINDCYSTGMLIGVNTNNFNLCGGFASSQTSANSTITNCYSLTNEIMGVNSGFTSGSENNFSCYFNRDNWPGIYLGYDDTTLSRTTAQMKTQSTYVGWNFSTIWKMDPYLNNGYPFLQYQTFYGTTVSVGSISTTPVIISTSNIAFTAQSGTVSLSYNEMNTPAQNLPSGVRSIGKYWEVSNITGGSIKLRLYYTAAQKATFTGAPKILHYTGGNWVELPTGSEVVSGSQFYVETTDYYSSFSPVTIGDGNTPLPVELSSFTLSVKGRDVLLQWETQTEVNSSSFTIERSKSEEIFRWETVGSVKASSASNSVKQYTFEDKKLQPGKFVYRLKMIDNDGSFEYSKSIEADINLPIEFGLQQNYPNPFNPVTTINYSLPQGSLVTLKVYDQLGTEVETLVNTVVPAGYHQYVWNAAKYSSGVYFYRLTAGNFTASKKLLLLK